MHYVGTRCTCWKLTQSLDLRMSQFFIKYKLKSFSGSLALAFLTAILHRGLRNCFFFRSHLLFPYSFWTFISLLFRFGLLFLFSWEFYSIAVTFWISSIFFYFLKKCPYKKWLSNKIRYQKERWNKVIWDINIFWWPLLELIQWM